MNPDEAAKKLRTKDGLPVLGLLTNPHGGADGKGMFVSLVEEGANLVDFTTVRSVEIDQAALEAATHQNGGAGSNARWWERMMDWRSWFPVGGGDPIARAAPDFDAAFAAGEFNNSLWRGWYVLEDLIYRTLEAPEIGDKRATVGKFIDQFRDMLISKIPAQDDQVIALSRVARAQVEIAKRAGKVISTANMDKLLKALAAIDSLRAEIGSVIEAGGGDTRSATTARAVADPAAGQEANVPTLDTAAVKAAALAASDTAITIHRSLNPSAPPGELTKVGQDAAQAVFRAAVMGPAQPAMPTNAFEAQMAQYGQLGNASDPTAQAISKLAGELTARFKGELDTALKPMGDKLTEIERLAGQHDVALFGGKVQRRKEDGSTETVEISGILGGKGSAPATPSGGAPERPVARAPEGGGNAEHVDAFGIQAAISGNKT